MTTGTYAGIVIFQTRDNTKAMTLSGNASGMTGTIYAPAAQLSESGNAQLNAALDRRYADDQRQRRRQTVTLDSPAGTVAYTPGPDPRRLRHQQPVARRHRPDHRHRRCLRRPEHLPGPRRLRHPVRPDRLRPDALCPVRPGVVVPDRAQPERPGHVPALDRPERPRHRQLGNGGGARRRMGPCHRPRRPDHPGRGQQPVALRPDGRRGHRRQPAGRVGGVDELGLRRRPGGLRRPTRPPTTACSTSRA